MSSTTVIRALKKWWWVVVALTLVGGLAGGLMSLLITPTYQSTAQLIVAYDAPAGAGSAELVQANNFAIQKVYAYQEIALSPRVLDEVIATLDLDMTADELAQDVSVSVPLNTPVMHISATAPNPQDAATLTTTVVAEFGDLVKELETPTSGGTPPVRIETLEEPQVSTDPSSPNVLVNIAVGLFAGFAAGIIWIAVAAASDRRIHSAHNVSTRTAPHRVLGSIPTSSDATVTALIDQPLSRVSEAYRTVAATLGHTPGARLGIIAVAPATPRDVTSPLTANLALAMQEFGVRTVLVDANLRSGTISSTLGLTGPGLAECLRGEARLDAVIQRVGDIAVLPSGATTESPAELMSGNGFAGLLKELKTSFDMVLVDTAPVLPLSDTLFAASAAESTVLAVSAGRVTGAELGAASDALTGVGVDVVGVVVVDASVAGVDADASTSLYRDLRPAEV